MKIKYTEITKIEKEETLLEILKLENDCDRETISYKTDSIRINVTFQTEYKEVDVRIIEPKVTLLLDTYDSTPEEIVGTIVMTLEALGVEYED